jgi:hypothetical protein
MGQFPSRISIDGCGPPRHHRRPIMARMTTTVTMKNEKRLPRRCWHPLVSNVSSIWDLSLPRRKRIHTANPANGCRYYRPSKKDTVIVECRMIILPIPVSRLGCTANATNIGNTKNSSNLEMTFWQLGSRPASTKPNQRSRPKELPPCLNWDFSVKWQNGLDLSLELTAKVGM